MDTDHGEKKNYEIPGLRELMDYEEQSHILQTWKPVAFLGAGQFSYVYKVVHRQTGKPAALKYIPNPKEPHYRGKSGSREDEINRMRFDASRREAEVMSRFRGDRYIVQYLERPEFLQRTFVSPWGEQVWQYAALICMPLYYNSDIWLRKVVGNRRAGVHLGMQMAQALMLFEQKGAFHRDIKPGNILMDEAGNFYLCDVGEAKMEYEDTTIGFHGTPWYMAPEIERLKRERIAIRSDHRSDIYSLGMVLYKIFNRNQYPFLMQSPDDHENSVLTQEGQKAYQRFERRRSKEGSASSSDRSYDSERAYQMLYCGEHLPKPCDADEPLSKVILKACAYDIEKRYRTAKEFYDALAACANEIPAASAAGKKGGAAPGNHKKIIAAGAAVILAAAGAAILIGGNNERSILLPTPSPTETPAVLNEYAVTVRKNVHMRTNTSEDAMIQKTLKENGTDVYILEQKAVDGQIWYLIEAENATGYVLAQDLTATPTPAPMPTAAPTATPTAEPTATPTAEPTATPTAEPTATPTAEPTATPTAAPTATPTAAPTATPTAEPTATPTAAPTATPTAAPTATPTAEPTATPTAEPTATPTAEPTATPTAGPTATPTAAPTATPTAAPTEKTESAFEETATVSGDQASVPRESPGGMLLQPGLSFENGMTVYFGRYEQDNKKNNGREKIAWEVMRVEGEGDAQRALLLAESGIDLIQYNNASLDLGVWESSSIRTWLNGTFMLSALTPGERAAILPTHLETTTDYIFCLSKAEFEELFQNRDAAVLKATTYARNKNSRVERNGVAWWLRDSAENNANNVMAIKDNGVCSARSSNSSVTAARPALWLNTSMVALLEDGTIQTAELTVETPKPTFEIGSTVVMGRYEQNNDLTDDAEPIEWTVIGREDSRALLLATRALDIYVFDKESRTTIWASCSLRTWLNGKFLKSTFTDEERSRIVLTKNENYNKHNKLYGIETDDMVFCLSNEEIKKYLPSPEQRLGEATAYAIAQSADVGNTIWWTRSSAANTNYVMLVDAQGRIGYWTASTGFERVAVRPAMWVDVTLFE